MGGFFGSAAADSNLLLVELDQRSSIDPESTTQLDDLSTLTEV